ADGELGGGGQTDNEGNRGSGVHRRGAPSEAPERHEGDRARRKHELRTDQHRDRAASGDDGKSAHGKKCGRNHQEEVQPCAHRRGPLPRTDPPPLGEGKVGAASRSPLPSAAAARTTTRTPTPTPSGPVSPSQSP